MIAYLSGAMENANDEGAGWRDEITLWLKKYLGHDVVNPVIESQQLVRLNRAQGYREWKETNPERFVTFVRKILNRDIKALTNKVDYVICLWNEDVMKGGGTHGEITLAYHYGIPVFLVNNLPLKDLSGWIMACSTEIFSDIDGLKSRLQELYSGQPG